MRNPLEYIDLNLHPTRAEQDETWETVRDENRHALVDFIGFLVVAALIYGMCI